MPAGTTPASHLRRLVEAGAVRRWPAGMPAAVRQLIERELALIAELGYERYFLTVHDLVEFARGRGILCQGRGSAANSAACYALGITEVDPARMSMLFERFISRERNEPPDIDVDFEHERREEVIQYLYAKYGRARAALTATVICYRPKSAVRDVGKALGLDPSQVERLAHAMQWWDGREVEDSRIRDAGFDTANPAVARVLALTRELIGFPRHLSQHTGGFVISRGPLEELVPIENAAMPERTVIQWDKDDLDELRLLKVDVLGLGMLTAIRRALALVTARRGSEFRLADIPAEDPAVYEMICRADTVGVFQIESRAQMAMLPRLRPSAITTSSSRSRSSVPGPIQGQMVHPYLRRRSGQEPVDYPGPEVEGVLSRTLGVPIFQEQVMQLAIVAAGFTPARPTACAARWRPGSAREASARSSSASSRACARAATTRASRGRFSSRSSVSATTDFLKLTPRASRCSSTSRPGSSGTSPPPSAARSSTASRWASTRRRSWCATHVRTASPCCPPASTRAPWNRRSRRRRAVRRRCASASTAYGGWRARRPGASSPPAPTARSRGFPSWRAVPASAGATSGRSPRRAPWPASPGTGIGRPGTCWGSSRRCRSCRPPEREEGLPLLRSPTEGEDIVADYRALGFTLARHPLALLRPQLEQRRLADGRRGGGPRRRCARRAPAGIVVTRQRPGSAGGVIFVTLEDETGYVNLVVWSRIADAHRKAMLGARLLGVRGRLQREGEVRHVVVDTLEDRSALLGSLMTKARSFR